MYMENNFFHLYCKQKFERTVVLILTVVLIKKIMSVAWDAEKGH